MIPQSIALTITPRGHPKRAIEERRENVEREYERVISERREEHDTNGNALKNGFETQLSAECVAKEDDQEKNKWKKYIVKKKKKKKKKKMNIQHRVHF